MVLDLQAALFFYICKLAEIYLLQIREIKKFGANNEPRPAPKWPCLLRGSILDSENYLLGANFPELHHKQLQKEKQQGMKEFKRTSYILVLITFCSRYSPFLFSNFSRT